MSERLDSNVRISVIKPLRAVNQALLDFVAIMA